jgi:BASS family bile acid:Na+ symporter
MQRLVNLFPLWALVFSSLAWFYPVEFSQLKTAIVPLLAAVMFCMGMTLTLADFKAVLQSPKVIFIAVLLQFLCMPFFAWGISRLLALPPPLLAGMVLVGASAGGTASNVVCYLARGNVALSVLMTVVSTLSAVLLMPLLSWLYLHQVINVPVAGMLKSILLIVLLPVLLGALINSRFQQSLHAVQSFFPLFSSLAIVLIIAIIMGLNHANLQSLAWPVMAAVVLHNALGLLTGYSVMRLFGYDRQTARTVSIEVGMQNSGLSVALAIQYFSSLAALPGALFSIWHNLSGSLLAYYWRRNAGETK